METSLNEYYSIKTNDNISLAVRARQKGQENIGIFFCCGYTSDLTGTKATRLFSLAEQKNIAATLFDYRGHGKSGGKIEEATIGQWIEDSLVVFDHACSKVAARWIVVGSSMGAWIASHILKARGKNVAAMMLIAPALDFPEKLLLPSFPKKEQKKIMDGGCGKWCQEGKTPEQGYILTKKFITEARKHHLLDKAKKIPCQVPVRVIAALNDQVVPFNHVLECFQVIEAEDALAIVVQQGDHRLSREQDLRLIEKTALELLDCVKNSSPIIDKS